MKACYQVRTGKGWSNCFSACVASLLELNVEQVPDFMWMADGILNPNWLDDFDKWLRPHGFAPLCIQNTAGYIPLRGVYYIVGGKVECGIMHAAIGFNNQIVHNPYPGDASIVEIVDYIVFVRTFQ